jgi:hypothetical protein
MVGVEIYPRIMDPPQAMDMSRGFAFQLPVSPQILSEI